MNKQTDMQELDIPGDDIDCWERYPKHNWVYDTSRLLDSQGIKWCPYETSIFTEKKLNINLESSKGVTQYPGYIYTKKTVGDNITTEVYIVKGEIKFIRHVRPSFIPLVGEIELRINAFVSLHLQKFTGIITVDTQSHEIYRIGLRPHTDSIYETNQEVVKLLKRIYKRTDITITLPVYDTTS